MRLFHGKEYVRIALANAYGLDREPWEKRLQWVGDNWCSLASLALAAKDPMAYTKAWMALQQSERGEPTGFIMGLDSTASGLVM